MVLAAQAHKASVLTARVKTIVEDDKVFGGEECRRERRRRRGWRRDGRRRGRGWRRRRRAAHAAEMILDAVVQTIALSGKVLALGERAGCHIVGVNTVLPSAFDAVDGLFRVVGVRKVGYVPVVFVVRICVILS